MCEHCEKGKPLLEGNWNDKMTVENEIDGYHIECYAEMSGKINFCPMCGTVLNEKLVPLFKDRKVLSDDDLKKLEDNLFDLT